MWIILIQRLTIEFARDVLLFPVWWYTRGLMRTFRFAKNLVLTGNDLFVPGLWLKNIMVPMFGQYDWKGRIMSFFMRVVNVVFRSFLLAVWIFIVSIMILIWAVLPIFVVFMITWSIF